MIAVIFALFLVVACYAVSFFITAGMVFLLCWGLNTIGVMTIAGIEVAFSWPLVLVIWLILLLLRSIFRVTISSSSK